MILSSVFILDLGKSGKNYNEFCDLIAKVRNDFICIHFQNYDTLQPHCNTLQYSSIALICL